MDALIFNKKYFLTISLSCPELQCLVTQASTLHACCEEACSLNACNRQHNCPYRVGVKCGLSVFYWFHQLLFPFSMFIPVTLLFHNLN